MYEMKQVKGQASVGDMVDYVDQMNPRTTFEVVQIVTDKWMTEYKLINMNDGDVVYSDLRQFGWTFTLIAR